MDNSAKRLLAILQRIHDFNNSTPIIDVWSQIFNCTDQMEALNQFSNFLNLINATAVEITDFDPDEIGHVQYWRSQIANAILSTKPIDPISAFISKIDNTSFSLLKLQSKLLHTKRRNRILLDDELTNLSLTTQEIIDHINNSDLSPENKTTLIRKFDSVLSAIKNHSVFGIDHLTKALDDVMLALIKDQFKILTEMKKSNSGLWDDFWTYWGRVADTLQNVGAVPLLADVGIRLSQLLPHIPN